MLLAIGVGAKLAMSDKNKDLDTAFSGQFDISKLATHLRNCIKEETGEVELDEYVFVFQQLYRFFCMLGTVFGFVGSDVKVKTEILTKFRLGVNKDEYETVEKMINYEKSTDYIIANRASNGSRTFLRLHRSLDFVSLFLSKTIELKDEDSTSTVCREAYDSTMSKYHPWLIQKGARIAMIALPTKKVLFQKVCADPELTINLVEDELIPEVIKLTRSIFDHCQKVYGENEILELP